MPWFRNADLDRASQRHLTQMPAERRAALPFVVDVRTQRVIAPWPRKAGTREDEERLNAVIDRLVSAPVPAAICWCWPDRPPVPVQSADPFGWLQAWSRDRQCYKI